MEKTLITNARSERAKFLGTHIKRLTSVASIKHYRDRYGHIKRPSTGNTWLTAPMTALIDRLEKKKFVIRKGNRLIPQMLNQFLSLPAKDLILRYRSILKGYLNYYSFADNRPHLKKLYWILWRGLMRTICRIDDISRTTFLRKYGPDIELKIQRKDGKTVTLDFKSPTLVRRPMAFMGASKFPDPLAIKDWKVSTISALGQPCANCGSEINVEMQKLSTWRA